MKLKRLFNGKNNDGGTEISGSFGGQASDDFLLGDDTAKKDDNSAWDAWSFRESKGDVVSKDRGRSSNRFGMRRSSSERPSARKRSKSEVSKRLKKLEVDFGMKLKKGGSKSVGGVFKGRSRDVGSRINSLALERSDSEPKIEQSGFDSLFGDSSDRTERTGTASKQVKKLRGGRRKSNVDESGNVESGPSRRSRSTSTRRKRSSSAVSRRKRSNSAKPKRTTKDFPEHVSTEEKYSVSAITTTKESKKKKKKKKKHKDGTDSSEVSSIPSKVEMNDCESQGSITMNDSFQGKKKKTKDKEKSKKSKQNKPKSKYPAFPAEDFGDGLEGLAEEFRRSKEKYDDEKSEEVISKYSSKEVPNTVDSNMFENAWNETKQKNTEIERSNSFANDENKNSFTDEIKSSTFGNGSVEEIEVIESYNTVQQEEILKLQQQLSTALQKQLNMSEEHIKEKNEFMNISRELERVRVELMESREERDEVMEELKDRDRILEEDRDKINNLELAIDKQLEKEEELMKNVHHSEEEIENLLDEIQKFETKLEDGESGGGASFVELRSVKKTLLEREDEVASQKLQIEQLEKELKDSLTVPQLQIQELDQENKALQGRLKGERLEYTSKLSAKDDVIQSLRTELNKFTASPDAQDLQSAQQKLADARADATTVREDLAATVKKIEALQGEREDFMEEFNLLKDNNVFMEKTVKELTEKADGLAKKVLEWTEKTYDWKKRAETAERKINEANDSNENAGSDIGEADPQGLFLQAAMEKGKASSGGRTGSWGLFKKNAKNAPEIQEESAEEVRIRVLEEQNLEYEAKIAQLSSDIVKMQTGHKEELYITKKKIVQLEEENESLTLQNSKLEQVKEV